MKEEKVMRSKEVTTAVDEDKSTHRQSSAIKRTILLLPKLLAVSAVTETLFYLPNNFRQTLFIHSSVVNFQSRDNGLLAMMDYMFHLRSNKQSVKGKL